MNAPLLRRVLFTLAISSPCETERQTTHQKWAASIYSLFRNLKKLQNARVYNTGMLPYMDTLRQLYILFPTSLLLHSVLYYQKSTADTQHLMFQPSFIIQRHGLETETDSCQDNNALKEGMRSIVLYNSKLSGKFVLKNCRLLNESGKCDRPYLFKPSFSGINKKILNTDH